LRAIPFTRPTVVAAVEYLGAMLTQARFDQSILRLELENAIPFGPSKSVTAKCALLGLAVIQRGSTIIGTLNGQMTLSEAVVREAINALVPGGTCPEQAPFFRGLALDGYVVEWDEETRKPLLRAALPEEVDLPAADDEVHRLLKQFGFTTPLGHLDQAIEAHTRGEWAAANSQIRSFLEGLLTDIAMKLRPIEAAQLPSSENKRALLGDIGFLGKDRNEWSLDGKNYVNGLFKMLHTHGSHPGLSDDDHSTFRLHIALITGRAFLRRLANGK
jgi:hypothetical protein